VLARKLGWLQELASTTLTTQGEETYAMRSGILYMEVCLAAVKIVAKGASTVRLSIGDAQSRKAWVDPTISELDRLESK
jgi:hypothetical protein